jgi:hypothetical protein
MNKKEKCFFCGTECDIYDMPSHHGIDEYEVCWGETKEKRAFEDRHVLHYIKNLFDIVFFGQGDN